MKNFRPTVAAVVMLMALFSPVFASAQHFEWAKGYSSSQENNYIKGTVTDSEGNLYILGQFRNDAAWDNEQLLPIAPYGPGTNSTNVIIAKISPDGEMVWKKVIHSNNMQASVAQDIKKVGDSAFACMVIMTMPCDDNYTYYLDTLLRGWSDYPAPGMYMANHLCNAFIVFDFDGNVKEQHILHITYTDLYGEDILNHNTPPFDPTPWYSNTCFQWNYASFDIDNEGNIYISRRANDWVFTDGQYYDVQVGTICGIKFWVDRRLAGYYPIAGDRPMKWYPQIVKFAPHFDTMLACRYVIQGQSDSMEYEFYNTVTKVDSNGNVYHICELRIDGFYQGDSLVPRQHSNILTIDSTLGIKIAHEDFNTNIGYMTKLTPQLTPIYALFIKDSITGASPPTSSRALFYDLDFDEDSSRGFISGFVQKNKNATDVYALGNTVLNIANNDAFVLSFGLDNGDFRSCSVVPSTQSSNIGISNYRGNLFSKDNRVFIQCQYYGGIELPSHTINTPDNNPGICLLVFDYSGAVISGMDYSAFHPRNRPGAISLVDSVLYLSNELLSNATFGNIQIPAQNNLACVAKYVDTAFMTPYIRPDPTGIPLRETGVISIFPNPAENLLEVSLPGNITSAAAITMSGVRIPLKANGHTIDIANLYPGAYIIEITTNSNIINHKIIKK